MMPVLLVLFGIFTFVVQFDVCWNSFGAFWKLLVLLYDVYAFQMLQMAYRSTCPEKKHICIQDSLIRGVHCALCTVCNVCPFDFWDVSFWTFSLGKPKIRQSCWVPLKIGHQMPFPSILPTMPGYWTPRPVQYLWKTVHNFVNFHFSSENPWFAELVKCTWGDLQLPFNIHAQATTYFTKGVLSLKKHRSALGISWQ